MIYTAIASVAPTATSTNAVCLTQTPTGGVAFTINGALAASGVATCGAAQLITVTTAGNESAKTITITGTDENGVTQTETMAGPNIATGTTTKYYKTITAISINTTAAAALTVGVNIGAVSPVVKGFRSNGSDTTSVGVIVTGTITYNIEYSFDDPAGLLNNTSNWFVHASGSAKTANQDVSMAFPISAVRIKVTASTSGSLIGRVLRN